MRALGVLLLFTVACGERVTGIGSDVTVGAQSLTFAATALGDTRTLPLTVSNRSRAPASLHLSAPAPFALQLDVRLGGGESRDVDVAFTPRELGAASATLHAEGDVSFDVALQGEGVAPAQCASASACRPSHRDPATNTCVEERAPDGTACSSENACVANGQCLAGTCVGAALSCDDHDRCTVDACEPSGGCVHFDAVCPAPLDPCQVAVCDPRGGCGTASAADGTQCGPNDCTTAHVCMAGVCKVLAVPEGFACGEESPCRAKGRCTQGACVQPPPTQLVSSWSRQLTSDVDFRAVTDPLGNLYWLQCALAPDLTSCQLVSTTPAGFERFHVTVPSLSSTVATRHLWSGGRIFIVAPGGAISAHSDATGAVVWRTSLNAAGVRGFVADRHGQLLLALDLGDKTLSYAVFTVSAATGAVLRTQALGGWPTDLVLDAQDDVFFEVSGTEQPLSAGSSDGGVGSGSGASTHLVSLSGTGAVRFSRPQDHSDPPVAAFNGELLLMTGEVRSTLDGSLRPSATGMGSLNGPSVMMAQSSRYRWSQSNCQGCDFVPPLQLEGWSSGATAARFRLAVAYAGWPEVTEPQLLADGSALFATRPTSGNATTLRAIDSSGAEKFSCVLGTDPLTHWRGATALTHGRWGVIEQVECPSCERDPDPVLRVFSTPGLEVAPAGWTGRAGNPGRSGSPR